MRPSRSSRPRFLGLVILLFAAGIIGTMSHASAADPAEDAPSDTLGRLCELGITYALSGQDARAESVFVSLLSSAPGDSRALNNLGNLHLWRGDTDVALSFYSSAERADTTDAGISLNQATALMIAGEDEAAREWASDGVRRAGGPEQAARLLGLHYVANDDMPRAGDRAQVSRDEVMELLRAATHAVPADSTSATRSNSAAPKNRKPVPAWRPAAARGASESDVTAVVYWKR